MRVSNHFRMVKHECLLKPVLGQVCFCNYVIFVRNEYCSVFLLNYVTLLPFLHGALLRSVFVINFMQMCAAVSSDS